MHKQPFTLGIALFIILLSTPQLPVEVLAKKSKSTKPYRSAEVSVGLAHPIFFSFMQHRCRNQPRETFHDPSSCTWTAH